jgi:uncharacterized protein YbaR (Trm112 family)
MESMSLDKRLLDVLACPVCKGPLEYRRAEDLLVCRFDRLGYPVRDGIPIMLEEEAQRLSSEQLEGGVHP